VHSKLGGSEVREGALDSAEGHFCGGSTGNYTTTCAAQSVHNRTCECDQRSPANEHIVNDDQLRRQLTTSRCQLLLRAKSVLMVEPSMAPRIYVHLESTSGTITAVAYY